MTRTCTTSSTRSARSTGKSEVKSRTPERIHNWRGTQLSIARHYGGCKFNGADYVIAYDEEGQPLVRVDVLKRTTRDQRGQPDQIGGNASCGPSDLFK